MHVPICWFIRAQLAQTPETSEHTSIKARLDQRQQQANAAAADGHDWLLPIPAITSPAQGIPGCSLDTYLRLVDATGRAVRGDKRGAIASDLPDILARLDATISVEAWVQTVARPRGLRGAAIGSALSLANEAARRGMRWIQRRCMLARGIAE